jgi:hypothetical protein
MRTALPLLLLLTAAMAGAAPRHADLESWFSRELLPYVERELGTKPRFRNESFRFVVMQEDSPQSEGNALALSLRDRLRDAMSDVPGIRIAWQGDHPGVGLVAGSQPLDCTRNEANYFIGLELTEDRSGRIEIRVRALDLEERSWVPGFLAEWQGKLTRSQFYEFRRIAADPTFRGERDAPWVESETDLMAAHLAYELGCKLLRQTADEYVIATGDASGDVDRTSALVELVSNNLAGLPALQFGSGESNAVIGGKAHRIDDDLYQYWVTVTPLDPASEMTALSADAYIRIEDEFRAAELVPEATFTLPSADASFLSGLSVVRLGSADACAADGPYWSDTSSGRGPRSQCFALEVQAREDAVVFFLNHQLSNGLVRLADDNCARRSLARIVRADQDVRLAVDAIQSGSWLESGDWSLSPRHDTYYVIAATSTEASRALSRHVEDLPQRCSASMRPGLEGAELKRWLEDLAAITGHWPASIDWRSIHVKEVY